MINEESKNNYPTTNSFNNDELIRLKRIEYLFQKNLKFNNKTNFSSRKRTNKIPNHRVKYEIITIINSIISNHINSLTTKPDLSETCDLIYTAQITYDEYTKINKTPLKEAIVYDTKITKLSKVVDIIEQIIRKETLDYDNINFIKKYIKYWRNNDKKYLEECKHKYEHLLNKHQALDKKKCERKLYSRDNYMFEVRRNLFYKNLQPKTPQKRIKDADKILNYWSTLWNKKFDTTPESYDNHCINIDKKDGNKIQNESIDNSINPTVPNIGIEDFEAIIKRASPWKAPGNDGIYYFWIKNLTSIHKTLIENIKNAISDPNLLPDSLLQGKTILIPKTESPKIDEFRPITLMSSIYKIITKLIDINLKKHLYHIKFFSINQGGNIKGTYGAKEQYIINQTIVNSNSNIISTWIDIKKAFDNVSHLQLKKILHENNFPNYINKFILHLLDNWKTTLYIDSQKQRTIKIEKGILQGDSLSPTLFCMLMETISRKLNAENTPKILIPTKDGFTPINHLLYIDDIKLYASNVDDMNYILNIAKKCIEHLGMEININKSRTNSGLIDTIDIEPINNASHYKYLGIYETNENDISPTTFKQLFQKITDRIELICNTHLNAKNVIQAINEYGLSLFNYYFGIIELDNKTLEYVDMNIRKLLISKKILYANASMERLYLKRTELGRGLTNIQNAYESQMLNLHNHIFESNETLRHLILRYQTSTNSISTIFTIKNNLKEKYQLADITHKELKTQQHRLLLETLKNKILHGKINNTISERGYDSKFTSKWLHKGRHSPYMEALAHLIIDRNLQSTNEKRKCIKCNNAIMSVDHVATRCKVNLNLYYSKRHNEILKAIHLNIARKYNFTTNKRLSKHNLTSILTNNKVKILTETKIQTTRQIRYNTPDILVFDHNNKIIKIIEIGITNTDNVIGKEMEKKEKYLELGNELKSMYEYKVVIIPIVLSWDGCVTIHFKNYIKEADIDIKTFIYSQIISLKSTIESLKVVCDNNSLFTHKIL
ncbi:MAG: reverse transcriptase family protein [Longicatena sp.]